jgi:hypothetical protein
MGIVRYRVVFEDWRREFFSVREAAPAVDRRNEAWESVPVNDAGAEAAASGRNWSG